MDTIFFYASKLIWALISPDSFLVILAVGAWVSLVLGRKKLSRYLLTICASLLLIISLLPVGEWLISPLENRFTTNAALPARVDGIIVLGGSIDALKSQSWQQGEMGASAERISNLLYLSNIYPDAQLVFTGGSGAEMHQDFKEAEMAQILFEQLNLGDRAIIYESESRNTYENAVHSKSLVNPTDRENWLLVTSAFHMPRSIGVFCRQQWKVQAYPVDHYSLKGNLLRVEFRFSENLEILRIAAREWVGLLAYRISGKTDRLIPSSLNYCGTR